MSITTRINLGMGAIIALIFVTCGFAIFQTNLLANTFIEYRGTARTSLIANEVTADLYEARIEAMKYRLTRDPEHLGLASNELSEILTLKPEWYQLMAGYPERSQLDGILESLSEYEALMKESHALDSNVEVLLEQTASLRNKTGGQFTTIQQAVDRNTETYADAGLAETQLHRGLFFLERFLADHDVTDLERASDEFAAAQATLERLTSQLQSAAPRDAAEATIADLKTLDLYVGDLGTTIKARNALYAQMDKIGPDALNRMQVALNAVINRQNTLGPQGAGIAQRAMFLIATLLVIGTGIGAVIAFTTGRKISRDLAAITAKMKELADGNLEIELEAIEESHEIAQMTNAMVVFLDNARQARDLEQKAKLRDQKEREREKAERQRELEIDERRKATEQREREAEQEKIEVLRNFQSDLERVLSKASAGDFTHRMNCAHSDEALLGLASVINKLLDSTQTNITDIVSSVGELAKGNLGIRIEGEREGDFKRLQDDFNVAMTTLSQTLVQVMQSGESVTSAASELETSATGMAKRAEDGAAAVEETSAAIEEISASIRQIVENAKAADEATRRVRENADKTRVVSDQTEESITAMTEASVQINRVVKVIEDIAFQINLLALNAGVEAARAGEAGRGFSVVASEVRALAQRSQEAVQEIGEVIEQNNQSVKEGVERVGNSRRALEAIISEVEVASTQISDIATAVEQQASGIEEVNSAIRSVDATAQTNAASLEEMTASSVSLGEDAKTLADALRLFHGVTITSDKPVAKNVVSLAMPVVKRSAELAKVAVVGGMPDPDLGDGWEEF